MQETSPILLVKTSSLGDVVHCLPAVSDIAQRLPNAQVDWLVEESFAAIARAHPFVRQVIPAAFRRWRKQPFAASTKQQFGRFRELLQGHPYAAVIDTQGLLKSAFLQRFAALLPSGKRHGYTDPRESLAARFYDERHAVAWGQHAVRRNRLLVATALGYALCEQELARPQYGLQGAPPATGTPPTAILLHGTSRADKEWPEAYWSALVALLGKRGLRCVLPSGTAAEAQRAARIARAHPQAQALEPGPLEALLPTLSHATCAIGADTGLTHLAAAFKVPTVALFSVSDPALTGAFSAHAKNLRDATPAAVLTALQDLRVPV